MVSPVALAPRVDLDHLSLFVYLELVLSARDPDLGEVPPAAWRARGWPERELEALGGALRRCF